MMRKPNSTYFRPFILGFVLIAALSWSSSAMAQSPTKKILQLSGIVLGEDSVRGLPGAHIYVPKRLDGTTSNYLGFFSLPVVVGDSIVFSCIGYKTQHYIVPDFEGKQVTLVVEMTGDTTMLDEVTIMPFPTEELFKEAVLALRLPPEDKVDEEFLNKELLALMMQTVPMDAHTNYKYYMDQMIYNQTYRYGMRPNPLLNPFNWAKFIKSLKKNK